MRTRGKTPPANGFTLIELLIVTVVISVLAAIALPHGIQVKERSFTGTMKYDLRNLMTAQEAYFTDNQTYAPTLADLGALYRPSTNVTLTLQSVTDSGWEAEAAHASTSRTCSIAVGATGSEAPSCATP